MPGQSRLVDEETRVFDISAEGDHRTKLIQEMPGVLLFNFRRLVGNKDSVLSGADGFFIFCEPFTNHPVIALRYRLINNKPAIIPYPFMIGGLSLDGPAGKGKLYCDHDA